MESRIHTRFAGVAALAAGLVLAVPAGAADLTQPGTATDAAWQIDKPYGAAHDRLPVHRTSDFGFFYRDRDGFFFGYDPRDGRRWYRDLRRQYYYDRYYDHRKRRWARDRRHYRDWYRRYYRHYGDYRDPSDRRYYRDYRDYRDRRGWDDRRRDRHHDRHENRRDKKHERRRGHSDEHRRGRGHDNDHRRRGRGRD
ncbi:hypothetical protein [Lentisalinibacter sediminis]|uniref:hypothetical protein n=1 Tax=Lentisalinibacter sediminis TaxID=2992237 RepID=UPI003864D37F